MIGGKCANPARKSVSDRPSIGYLQPIAILTKRGTMIACQDFGQGSRKLWSAEYGLRSQYEEERPEGLNGAAGAERSVLALEFIGMKAIAIT